MCSPGRIVALGIGLLIGLVHVPAPAQEATPFDALREAFAAGNAPVLLRDAGERVAIALLGNSKLYSRAQATYVMQDFFQRYPPEAFTLQNNERDGSNWFATGRYRYRHAEQPLQVFLHLRLKDEQWELREVRIEQRRRE